MLRNDRIHQQAIIGLIKVLKFQRKVSLLNYTDGRTSIQNSLSSTQIVSHRHKAWISDPLPAPIDEPYKGSVRASPSPFIDATEPATADSNALSTRFTPSFTCSQSGPRSPTTGCIPTGPVVSTRSSGWCDWVRYGGAIISTPRAPGNNARTQRANDPAWNSSTGGGRLGSISLLISTQCSVAVGARGRGGCEVAGGEGLVV